MRYYEIVGREHPIQQDGPRKTLSLYVMDGEYADCAGMIQSFRGKVVGINKLPVGGMTIQVRCPTVDAAYELLASWIDHTYASAPPAHRAGVYRVERGTRPLDQGR